jgi:hypothetical protein
LWDDAFWQRVEIPLLPLSPFFPASNLPADPLAP